MELDQFLKSKKKYPIMFVGSGMSKRYLNTPDWETLLKECYRLIGFSVTDYQAQKNIIKQNGVDPNNILLVMAEKLIKYYEENYSIIDSLNDTTKRVSEIVTNNEKDSRLKELICEIIKGYNGYQLQDEINAFKKTNSKVYTYITTNYDDFINTNIATDREVVIGNDVILKDPVKSIYKIHGCISDSNSIIITSSDYEKFKEDNILLFSQLISFCINQPIIFIGYSLNDINIREILETIFSFVKPNSVEYDKLKENFIFIEYKENEMQTKMIDRMYQVGDNTITIKAIETDNYKKVFESISNMEIPMAISELRKIKNITKQIEMVDKNAPTFKISKNLEGHESDELVLMLSLEKDIIPLNVRTEDIINKYWDYENDNNLRKQTGIHTLPTMDIQNNQYFPSYIFKNECNKFLEIQNSKLADYEKTKRDICPKEYNSLIEEIKKHKTLKSIINSSDYGTTKKKKLIFMSVYNDYTTCDELKFLLKNKEILKEKSIELNKTDYNRLITLYDYKKYNV